MDRPQSGPDKARDHSAEAANEALRKLFVQFGDLGYEVFKTLTTDNGSEME
jgi:IS30 family transposase